MPNLTPPTPPDPVAGKSPVLRELDRQLMRVRLRPHGSPPFVEAEAGLVGMVRRHLLDLIPASGGVPAPYAAAQDLADDVCGELVIRWRAGRMYEFTDAYLRNALDAARAAAWGRDGAALPNGVPAPGGAVWQQVEAAAVEERVVAEGQRLRAELRAERARVTAGLSADERALFDAWVRGGDRRGWQTDHAEAVGRSDAWVNRHLNGLRATLRAAGHAEPDTFAAALRACDRLFADAPPPADAPADGPPDDPGDAAGPAGLTHEALVAALQNAFPELRAAIRRYAAAPVPPRPGSQAMRVEQRLDDLHAACVRYTTQAGKAAAARAFYVGRVLTRQDEAGRAVREANLPWPEDHRALALRLVDLGRERKTPFDDLPAALGRAADDVVALLGQVREAVAQDRKRRAEAKKTDGGQSR